MFGADLDSESNYNRKVNFSYSIFMVTIPVPEDICIHCLRGNV